MSAITGAAGTPIEAGRASRLSAAALSGYLPAFLAAALPVFVAPWMADRFILPRAALVIGGACLGIALALQFGRDGTLGALRWPLIASAAAALLAFAFSTSWPLGLAGSYFRYETLPVRLGYLGLLASTVWLLRDARQRDWLIAAFVAGTSVACLKAWAQWAQHVPFRPDGDLGNANMLAALVAMAAPLAVERVWRSRGRPLWAWAGSLVLLGFGLYVSNSRSGFVAVAVALAVMVVLALPLRLVALAGALAAALVPIGLVVLVYSPLRRLNGDPPKLRLHLWADGLQMVAARPLTGFGEDTTGVNLGHFLHRDYATGVTFDRIHSGPIDLAATQGLLGLLATGSVLAVLAYFAWRRRRDPAVRALASALAGYSAWVLVNFDWAPVTGMFWVLAGVLWVATSGPRPATAATPRTVAARPMVGAVAAVPAALLAVAFGFLPMLADTWYFHGLASRSVTVDPLQAQYHWQLGTISELQLAAALGESEPGMYVQLGDLELDRGDRGAARAAYRRALEIDPYYSDAAQRLAELGL